jgi:hypothetical protein
MAVGCARLAIYPIPVIFLVCMCEREREGGERERVLMKFLNQYFYL